MTVTRYRVVPGNWASVRGGKWHLVEGEVVPAWRDEVTAVCGVKFYPLNVTGGEAPPTNDAHICLHCYRGQPPIGEVAP